MMKLKLNPEQGIISLHKKINNTGSPQVGEFRLCPCQIHDIFEVSLPGISNAEVDSDICSVIIATDVNSATHIWISKYLEKTWQFIVHIQPCGGYYRAYST